MQCSITRRRGGREPLLEEAGAEAAAGATAAAFLLVEATLRLRLAGASASGSASAPVERRLLPRLATGLLVPAAAAAGEEGARTEVSASVETRAATLREAAVALRVDDMAEG